MRAGEAVLLASPLVVLASCAPGSQPQESATPAASSKIKLMFGNTPSVVNTEFADLKGSPKISTQLPPDRQHLHDLFQSLFTEKGTIDQKIQNLVDNMYDIRFPAVTRGSTQVLPPHDALALALDATTFISYAEPLNNFTSLTPPNTPMTIYSLKTGDSYSFTQRQTDRLPNDGTIFIRGNFGINPTTDNLQRGKPEYRHGQQVWALNPTRTSLALVPGIINLDARLSAKPFPNLIIGTFDQYHPSTGSVILHENANIIGISSGLYSPSATSQSKFDLYFCPIPGIIN